MLNEIKDRANDKMQKALNNLNESLGGLRAGRANPHILDKVTVDYYGAATAINQLASVAAVSYTHLDVYKRQFYASDYDADTFVVNKEYVNSVFKPAERERSYSRFLL